MIDMRKEMAKLFDQYSHNIAYLSCDTRFRCHCYVERSGESSPHCSDCFGTGYAVDIKPVRTRRNSTTVETSLPALTQADPTGQKTPYSYVYYLEHGVKPKVYDLILEVEWDKQGVPRKILEKHRVNAVEPKFGYKGRIEFYQVYCRSVERGEFDEVALRKY